MMCAVCLTASGQAIPSLLSLHYCNEARERPAFKAYYIWWLFDDSLVFTSTSGSRCEQWLRYTDLVKGRVS
jgi:hypothetical protein